MGHCDCVAALIYMYRMANFHHNPFPDTGPSSRDDVLFLDFEGEERRDAISRAFSVQ